MRVLKTIVGVLSVLIGLGCVAGGTLAILAFGPEGRLELLSPELTSGKDARALIMDVENVDAGFSGSESLGETTIGVESKSFNAMFIGLGATSRVDEYLSGVAYDVVRYEDDRWVTSVVPGSAKPTPPKDETFWTRRSVGTSPTVVFREASGPSTTFVVMNADGSPGVSATITVGYRSSLIFPMAVTAIVIGALLIVLPLILGYRGRRKRKRANAQRKAPSGTMPTAPTATPSASVLPGGSATESRDDSLDGGDK